MNEILGLAEYEVIRERFRARIIAEKKKRRVLLGDRASAVFENNETVLWQIQEMLRAERITRASAVQHEIDTYNELVPGPFELSATVMIEIDDADERDRFLIDGKGLEQTIYVAVDGERVTAVVDPARLQEDRLSAVLYLKFPLGEAKAARLRSGTARLALGVDHAVYKVEVELSSDTVASLAGDVA
jgi:hypothetical protein